MRCYNLCFTLNYSLELLCLLLILGTFFLPAFRIDADAANASGTLGVCNIQDPEYDKRNADNTPYPSEYNRVYFGWVPETPTGKAKNNKDSKNNTTDVDPYKNGSMNMTNTPIYWRVLYTTANDDAVTPALFMLTEYALASSISWDVRYYDNGANQRWQFLNGSTKKTDSSLRKFLQGTSCSIDYAGGTAYTGDGLYDECFDREEQDVMLATTKTETGDISWYKNGNNTYTGKACGLDQEKIFLLSASEVTDSRYGFEGSGELNYKESSSISRQARDTNRITKPVASTGKNKSWWLRSACSREAYHVACVNSSGYSHNDVNANNGIVVRFALNLPLSSVLFAQDASAEGASPSPTFVTIPPSLTRTKFKYGTSNSSSPTMTEAAKIYKVENSTDVEYSSGDTPDGAKLTIADQTRTDFFKVTNFENISELYAGSGQTISLHYEGAIPQEQNSADIEYISAIIKYIGTNEDNTGTGIYGGNGLYYARIKPVGDSTSGNVSMTIPQDLEEDTTYTLIVYNELDRGKYKTNYAGYDTITLHIKPPPPELTSAYKNEFGNNLKLNISGENLSHISTLLGEKITDITGNDTTTNLQLGENTTGIIVYDHYGSSTSLYTNDIHVDKTPPYVIVTRSGGTYTITVSDNESGVWKITNGDGTKVYHDYS